MIPFYGNGGCVWIKEKMYKSIMKLLKKYNINVDTDVIDKHLGKGIVIFRYKTESGQGEYQIEGVTWL